MNQSHPLKDLSVLVVDDQVDILETMEELLDMCAVTTASDYASAHQYLMSYTYDLVILDIMGVDGFELLKTAVKRGFVAVMFSAYAFTPESLEKAMRLGAVSFLPKDHMAQMEEFLVDVVTGGGQPAWGTMFHKLADLLKTRFGPDWKENNRLFKDFEQSVKQKNV